MMIIGDLVSAGKEKEKRKTRIYTNFVKNGVQIKDLCYYMCSILGVLYGFRGAMDKIRLKKDYFHDGKNI